MRHLQEDLAARREIAMAPEPGPYHEGDSKGISLYSQGGRRQSANPGVAGRVDYKSPQPLLRAPYMRPILNALTCPTMVVRRLGLPPCEEIHEHADSRADTRCSTMRSHGPIVSYRDARSKLGCEFALTAVVMPCFSDSRSFASFRNVHGNVEPSGLRRLAVLDDPPIIALAQTEEVPIGILGLSSGCSFKFTLCDPRRQPGLL